MKAVIFLVVVCLMALTGCAANYANKSPEEVATAVEIRGTEFDAGKMYVGPQLRSATRRGIFEDNQTVKIVATQDNASNELVYFVYVSILYSGNWRFYESASFVGGGSIKTTELDRSVNSCTGVGCIYTEQLSFPVSYSRLMQTEDFRFRLNSKKGISNEIVIPQSYLKGFILGLQRAVSR